MNNKQIKKDIEKIYKPNTAFGNDKILELIKQLKVPNDDGNFEIIGDSISEIVGVNWECVSCGSINRDEVMRGFGGGYEDVEAQCERCKAKHLIEVS